MYIFWYTLDGGNTGLEHFIICAVDQMLVTPLSYKKSESSLRWTFWRAAFPEVTGHGGKILLLGSVPF